LSITAETILHEEIENFSVQQRYDDTSPDLLAAIRKEALLNLSHETITKNDKESYDEGNQEDVPSLAKNENNCVDD
jgi:hypothetical protein